MKGLPAMCSRDDLQEVATGLMCRIMVHGCSCLKALGRSGPGFDGEFSALPATGHDTGLQCDRERGWLGFMPKTGTAGEMMAFYFGFLLSSPCVPIILKGRRQSQLVPPPAGRTTHATRR
jgi:hypothetical protein